MKAPRFALLVVVVAVAAALAGCGTKKETLGDTSVIYLPGVNPAAPPWRPEYAHLGTRIARLHLPPVGKEQVHTHALVHIYNDGLLIQVQPNIGLYPPRKLASSVHTHDSSGIIHMESDRPHKFTLGGFFAIWGVPFGTRTLGNLTASGKNAVHVYANGRPVTNPAGYVIRDHDSISIGYGADGSFPHNPDRSALKTVSGKGGKQAACSKSKSGKPAKSCVVGATG
jgi:hypothetical protein